MRWMWPGKGRTNHVDGAEPSRASGWVGVLGKRGGGVYLLAELLWSLT